LASCAKAAALTSLAGQAKALENFLNQLCRDQMEYAEAALSTITLAVEVMSQMAFETRRKKPTASRTTAVYVDEAPYSNRAVEEALLNAGVAPVCFEDPARAREYLVSHRTDLIVSNLVLPEAHRLAVADIRQLRWHAETPVVFGPESSITIPLHDQMPMSAPRLDKLPLLLAELIVRALNAVHGGKKLAPASKTARQASTLAKAVSLPSEENLEPFVRIQPKEIPQQEEVAALEKAAETTSVPSGANHPPQRFAHLFTSADIPSEPILRAMPVTPDADQEAELVAQLPAPSIDGTVIDERPVEELPLSTLEAQTPPPASPEPMVEDQPTETAWPAATAANNGQPSSQRNTTSESEQNEIAEARETVAAISNYWQAMNNQLQTAPADYAPQSNGSQAGDAPHHQQDLVGRVCAAEMALYHAQSQIQQKDKDIEALQNQLAQAKADCPAGQNMEEQKAQARCAELEEEVVALRQAFEGLNGNFSEQQTSPEAGKQLQELEQRLSQSAAELEKQKENQQQAEAELRRQLETANGASQQSEAACKQAEARCAQLEQDLAAIRKAHEELANKASKEQKSGAQLASQGTPSAGAEPWVGAPASELEQLVRQGVAALARATAELAKERGERQRSQQRTAELNGRLQALHEDLTRTLKGQREDLARISALEEQQQQTSQALERCTTDAEQQRAERLLAEEQLQKAKELNAQLRKDLAFFDDANKKFGGARLELQDRLEANLNATRESEARLKQESAERQRIAESLEETRRELQNQTRRREAVEQELQATRDALQEREAKLKNEAAERLRLNQAQDSIQRNLLDGSERDLEFSKVQSALQLEQVERKRQESQLARMRQSAIDSAHAARAVRTGLRRQIREPVDNLVNTARSLLELEMGEEQKKLAEAFLQDVLLVQTRLREPALAQAESQESATPGAS
jgi:hypothetical protein